MVIYAPFFDLQHLITPLTSSNFFVLACVYYSSDVMFSTIQIFKKENEFSFLSQNLCI